MNYNVKNGDKIATVNLDGSECAVKFSSKYNVFEVINNSSAPVLMALTNGASKGDDGTYSIPAGKSFPYPHMRQLDTVYLTGSGEVTVLAKNDTNPSFRNASAGGQGGGSGISFSTEEQNTGIKWIDGKDIYQKTIVCDPMITIPASSWKVISEPKADKESLISAYIVLGVDSGGSTGCITGTGAEFIGTNIEVMNPRAVNQGQVKYITLQYTKTEE